VTGVRSFLMSWDKLKHSCEETTNWAIQVQLIPSHFDHAA
jgi:hypothetical protein